MKNIILIFIVFLGYFSSKAQDWNPYVNQGIISPAPLLPWEFGGTGVISFNIGNTGSSPLLFDPIDDNMNMTLVMTLSDGVPNNSDPLAALGGSWVNKFNWRYEPAINTYFANQIADIPGDSQGTITVQYEVKNNTPITVASNGFNINLQPAPYANGSNSTDDDAVSSYTFTRAYDYGDAPVSYGEARHEINLFLDPDEGFIYTKYLVLGTSVDQESNKTSSLIAEGDDLNGNDDEDGVIMPVLTVGTTVTIPVSITTYEISTGYLNAWFDWNGDGDFLDSGERVTPMSIAAAQTGTYNITVDVPIDAITTAPTYARFRVGPANTSFLDASYRDNSYGESEDYMITILDQPSSIGDYVWEDLDGDGIQDVTENCLDGIEILLHKIISDPNTGKLDTINVGSTISHSIVENGVTVKCGYYEFTNLTSGNYILEFNVV